MWRSPIFDLCTNMWWSRYIFVPSAFQECVAVCVRHSAVWLGMSGSGRSSPTPPTCISCTTLALMANAFTHWRYCIWLYYLPLHFDVYYCSGTEIRLIDERLVQKETPSGEVTHSAHPARFSPDDQFSRHRVTIKKRFGLLPSQQAPLQY